VWWAAGDLAPGLTQATSDGALVVADDAHRLGPDALAALASAARAGVPMHISRRPTIDSPELASLDEAVAGGGVEVVGPLSVDEVAVLVATVTGRTVSPETAAAVHEAAAGMAVVAAALADALAASLGSRSAGALGSAGRVGSDGSVGAVRGGQSRRPAASGGAAAGPGGVVSPRVAAVLGEPAPVLVARVQRRFAMLAPEVSTVARVLALRLELDDDVLAGAADTSSGVLPAALRTLRDEGLLVPGEERMIPAVALAVFGELSAAERRRLHEAVGRALVAAGADPVVAATQLRAARVRTPAVAGVYTRAGEATRFADPAAALAWFDDADDAGADPADTAAGRAEAGALLGLPVDVDPQAADPRLARLAGAAAAQDGRTERAADTLLAADPALAVPVLVGVGRLDEARVAAKGDRLGEAALAAAEDPDAAVPLLIEAAEAAERAIPTAVLPDTPHALGAIVAVVAGDLAAAEHLLERAAPGGPAAGSVGAGSSATGSSASGSSTTGSSTTGLSATGSVADGSVASRSSATGRSATGSVFSGSVSGGSSPGGSTASGPGAGGSSAAGPSAAGSSGSGSSGTGSSSGGSGVSGSSVTGLSATGLSSSGSGASGSSVTGRSAAGLSAAGSFGSGSSGSGSSAGGSSASGWSGSGSGGARGGFGGPAAAVRHRLLLAWARMRAGRFDGALVELARPETDLPGRERLLRAAIAAGIARRRGDIAGLRAVWGGVEPILARRVVDLWQLEAAEELLVAAARLQQRRRVEPVLALLERTVDGLGRPPAWAAALGWLRVQVAVAAADPAEARQQADRIPAGAGPRGEAQRAAAAVWADLLAGTAVPPDTVLAVTDGLAAVQLPWEASRLAGQAAIHTTDPVVARRLLERARELSEPDTTAAEQPAAKVGRAGSLSERELAVAKLVLAGSTHREIGAQLYIAPKTVEHHVARIRSKLGAGSRAELLAVLREIVSDPG
jgi:DNA-binding CsgD family transcriptional regulator